MQYPVQSCHPWPGYGKMHFYHPKNKCSVSVCSYDSILSQPVQSQSMRHAKRLQGNSKSWYFCSRIEFSELWKFHNWNNNYLQLQMYRTQRPIAKWLNLKNDRESTLNEKIILSSHADKAIIRIRINFEINIYEKVQQQIKTTILLAIDTRFIIKKFHAQLRSHLKWFLNWWIDEYASHQLRVLFRRNS